MSFFLGEKVATFGFFKNHYIFAEKLAEKCENLNDLIDERNDMDQS